MKSLCVFSACLLLFGCTGLFGQDKRQGVSSSLVDYLYPSGEEPPKPSDSIPALQLPLRIGLAFVPSAYGGGALTEAERIELLNKVKANFAGREFVAHIEVIPEAYMRTGRGFPAMDQLARLYDLDVMALVSYDQVAQTAERGSSFLYWTIVGAYVVEGNKNDVNTFVDTAVFDVPTRKLLFRAPGVSEIKSTSTLVGIDSDVRAAQQKGFAQAMDSMTANLDTELDGFKQRVLTEGTARITRADGTSYGAGGGGSIPYLTLIGLAALLALRRTAR